MKKRYDNYRVFTLFLVLFWLVELLRTYLYADVALSENMVFQEWLLRLLRDVFLAIGISGFIIVGIRELRRDGFGLKKVLPVLSGVLMGLGLIFFSWFVAYKIDSLSQSVESQLSLEQLKKDLNKQNLSSKKRERLSKIYAELYYIKNEKSVNYLKNGSEVLYQPTQEKLLYIEKRHQQENQMVGIRRAKFIWLGLLLISLMIGLFSPISRDRSNRFKSSF